MKQSAMAPEFQALLPSLFWHPAGFLFWNERKTFNFLFLSPLRSEASNNSRGRKVCSPLWSQSQLEMHAVGPDFGTAISSSQQRKSGHTKLQSLSLSLLSRGGGVTRFSTFHSIFGGSAPKKWQIIWPQSPLSQLLPAAFDPRVYIRQLLLLLL